MLNNINDHNQQGYLLYQTTLQKDNGITIVQLNYSSSDCRSQLCAKNTMGYRNLADFSYPV